MGLTLDQARALLPPEYAALHPALSRDRSAEQVVMDRVFAAPALVAGNAVVFKPAELTPLTALAAAELAIRAGIPAGVLNMITADADNSIAVGKVLCASDVVRHISFTGSTEVGRILMAQSAPSIKKLSLDLD